MQTKCVVCRVSASVSRMCGAAESRHSASIWRLVGASQHTHLGGITDTQGEDRRTWAVLLALLVMVGVLGSLRTSPPAPPPPGTGVTSSPFDPLWGTAPPAFFSVDTNGTGLAGANPRTLRITLMLFPLIKHLFSPLNKSSHSNFFQLSIRPFKSFLLPLFV